MRRRAAIPGDGFPAYGLIEMIERLDAGVLCLDESLRVTYANEAGSRLMNKPHEKTVGLTLGRVVPEGVLEKITREIDRAREHDRIVTLEMYFPPPVDLPLLVRCIPARKGVNLFLEDITGNGGVERSFHIHGAPPPSQGDRGTEEVLEPAKGAAGCGSPYPVVYDVLNQGVLEFDEYHRLVSTNKAASKILGMDLGKKIGATALKIFSSSEINIDSDGLAGKMADAAITQGVYGRNLSKPVHIQVRKAKKKWFAMDSVVGQTGRGKGARHVFIILSDISEIKENEASLELAKLDLEHAVRTRTIELMQANREYKEQSEILQKVIDSIPVMLILYDASGKVRLVNREFEHLTGWASDRIFSMDILSSLFPHPLDLGEFWRAMTKNEPGWHDFRLLNRLGTVLESSWTSTRLSDGSTIAIGIDVGRRKEMEQDVRRLAAAIEQAGDGIVLVDHAYVVRYVNRAFEDLCERSREEIVGRSLDSLDDDFRDDGSEEERGRFGAVLKSGEGKSGVFRRKRRDGSDMSVTVSTAPVYDKLGNVINHVVVMRDITETLRLQARLYQAQKMEAIGTLAGGIAHDLRNTFTPILLNTESLMLDLGEQSPLFPVLEEIKTATAHGVDLVNHILTFSRRRPQPKSPLDIVPVVREALSFLRSSLPATIEIRENLDAGNATILADPTQIKQILINLGSNAGYAMRGKGGVLDVELAEVSLDGQAAPRISPGLAPGRYLEIRVGDTGVGMDSGVMENIFNPFFTTRAVGEGTGLGLSVVHGIVKEHKGAITVESSPEKGTVFTIYLPVV